MAQALHDRFEHIDASPPQASCEGIDGRIEEHRSFVDEEPEHHVREVCTLVAAEKTEHDEIAADGNLAFLADEFGMDEAVDLLVEHLDEAMAALERLTDLTEDGNDRPVPT